MKFHYLFTFSHQTFFTPKPLSFLRALVAVDFRSVFKSNHCFQHNILGSLTWYITNVQKRGKNEGACKRLKRRGTDASFDVWEPVNLGGLKRVQTSWSPMSSTLNCCHSTVNNLKSETSVVNTSDPLFKNNVSNTLRRNIGTITLDQRCRLSSAISYCYWHYAKYSMWGRHKVICSHYHHVTLTKLVTLTVLWLSSAPQCGALLSDTFYFPNEKKKNDFQTVIHFKWLHI